MRISDWSSDVCSSDLTVERVRHDAASGIERLQDAVVALAFCPRRLSIDRQDDQVAAGEGLVQCRNRPLLEMDAAGFRGRAKIPGGILGVHRLAQYAQRHGLRAGDEIGRASWRERGWQEV